MFDNRACLVRAVAHGQIASIAQAEIVPLRIAAERILRADGDLARLVVTSRRVMYLAATTRTASIRRVGVSRGRDRANGVDVGPGGRPGALAGSRVVDNLNGVEQERAGRKTVEVAVHVDCQQCGTSDIADLVPAVGVRTDQSGGQQCRCLGCGL